MAGLSNAFQTTSDVTTSLPSWYSNAQQNLGTQAVGANAPMVNQTAGQAAVNTFAPGNSNQFTQGTGILNTIGTGAANPWITTTDASGNPQTTGNPQTAMGGLFNAQTGYLNQVMPNITAAPEAQNIGTGNFGSLRGETAVNKAKADAMANLFQQQNQAALQNQQTGVQAGTGLGSIGAQGVQAALNTGTYQMEAPTKGLYGQANVLNALKPGTTVSTVATPSPLNQAGAVGSLLTGGVTGLNSILSNLGVTGGLSGLLNNGTGSTTPQPNYTPTEGQSIQTGQIEYNSSGTPIGTIDASGNVIPFGSNLSSTGAILSPEAQAASEQEWSI